MITYFLSYLYNSYCTYLSKGFLPIILEVFWVDIKVVFIDGEGLGTLSDTRYKLLHLQQSAAWHVPFKVPHRNVGGSDTICRQEKRGVTGLKVKVC